MTLLEIKQAISEGKKVYWKQNNYEVQKCNESYYIVCLNNDDTIGLTWKDNTTLNGDEKDFYIGE